MAGQTITQPYQPSQSLSVALLVKDRSVTTTQIIELKHTFKEAPASLKTAFPDDRSGVLVLPCMVQMMCSLLGSGCSAQLVPVDAAERRAAHLRRARQQHCRRKTGSRLKLNRNFQLR